jgi:hypothetical protein
MPSEVHGKVLFEGKPERRAFALAGCGTRRISRSEVVRGRRELSNRHSLPRDNQGEVWSAYCR